MMIPIVEAVLQQLKRHMVKAPDEGKKDERKIIKIKQRAVIQYKDVISPV